MHDCYSCIFTYSSFKLIRKCYKIVKITVFCTLDHSVEMASACEIKHQKMSFPLTRLTQQNLRGKKVIPGGKILSHNVRQANLSLFQGFSAKNHVQMARECHDLNMDFVV